MKNTIIFIAIAFLAGWYFMKEGEKVTEIDSEMTPAQKIKAGIRFSLKSFLNIAEEAGNPDIEKWEPTYVGDVPPDYMMKNENDPNLSAFHHVLKPRRGSFITGKYSQSTN